jgi:methylated-DNA-[protein]-cysteine S-methyltransferase
MGETRFTLSAGLGGAKKLQAMSEVAYTRIDSPVGKLLLAADAQGLRLVSFESGKRAAPVQPEWKEDKAPFAEVIRQLHAYFGGELREFDLPMAAEGSEFQLRVWNGLRTIPYGETISYAQLAQKIGNPQAVRAVGLANGCNPIPIIVPCHRVIGSNGSLTGFGGGLANKKILLDLESRQLSLLLTIFGSQSIR